MNHSNSKMINQINLFYPFISNLSLISLSPILYNHSISSNYSIQMKNSLIHPPLINLSFIIFAYLHPISNYAIFFLILTIPSSNHRFKIAFIQLYLKHANSLNRNLLLRSTYHDIKTFLFLI